MDDLCKENSYQQLHRETPCCHKTCSIWTHFPNVIESNAVRLCFKVKQIYEKVQNKPSAFFLTIKRTKLRLF